jgi:soluble lytic murein transglycosylase
LYEEAEQAYMELVADPSEEGRRAAVALARAALQDDDPARALALLSLAAPAGLEALPAAGRYHYGDAAERIYEYSAAAEAYLSYGAAVPAMIDVANLAAGNALFSAGQYSDAHEAFTVARDQAGDESTAYLAALRSGNALLRKGPLAEAVAAYEQAHGLATNDADRSHALAGLIAAHLDAGDDVLAAETRRRLIRELPATSLAPTALERLEASGHPVQPHERAAVLQGAGDHAGALAAYDEAISSEPRAPAAWHLAVIKSHRATGSHSGAIAAADLLLAAEPSDPLAPEAAWLRARSQQSLDMDRSAAESLAALSLTWPGHERATEALWRRAGIVEMLDGWRAAAEAFDELAERYPGDDQAHEARFRSAFLRLFAGATADAVQRFAALADESDGETRARAHYWLGRIAWDAGDAASAATHWRQAKAADERDYYGLLAADRLGEAPGAALPEPADPELADPERSVAVWLEGWLQGVDADTWDAFRRDVGHRRDVARAAAWLDLGERRAAIRTMDNAVRGSSGDAAGLAALAFEARDLGLHGPSIAAASRVLAAAPPGHEIPAPAALLRLVYPDAFGGLVRDNAAERSVPAALMFALVRAESRFEPTARSSAGATGLTQVMPSTGESIAVWLGETDFETADLYRPETAVRFGAWFLGQQLQQFDSRVPLALAAYNGGPGNAQRWWDEAGGDVDAFAEVIDYSETRKYVRWVTEAQARYESLYGDPR